MYHKLLQRQIRKYLPDDLAGHEGLKAFLASINNSYGAFERDRELMDHAFTVSEKEFVEVNQELNSLADQRLLTLKQLNETISSLLGTSEPSDENLVSLSEKIKEQVSANNITQRELRESEERNRLVMNSSLDAIVISNDKGKIEYWNPRAEQLFGWTREEALAKPMNKLFIPSHLRSAHNAGMNRYLNSGVSRILNQELELTAINKTGDEFPVELVVVTYQQNGKNYFCGFMKDISSRKRSENLIKEQEEKYRNIITNMNLGMLEVDNNENILFTNQRFCDISGYQPEELIGSKTSKFLLSQEETLMLEKKRRLRTRGISDSYEIAVKNKAGEVRWWFVSGAPNYNDKGDLVGSIGIHLDITKQKELESALELAKEKAEEASVAKEAFLANMSHEIRTPLNAIIGMIRELSRERLSPKQQTYLSHTDTAARHLLSIVNNILDISKIEAGELKLDQHNFSLRALITNMVSILNFKASKKNIELTSVLSEDIWPAYLGDSVRIRQVLINLLDNAIKFTMEGSVQLRIEVLRDDQAEQLIGITITDTGIGMDADYMEQLFSKFSQAEKSTSRRFGGTGLGMSITKEIIKLMDGVIEVKSVKGQGTEFKLSVTLLKGNLENVSDRTEDSQYLLRGAHILLVEDNVMNRFIANKSLSHFGCTADEAKNGLIALELLKEKKYDLILMDIQMPGLDGVETTKIIRNDLKLDLPIIAVTANAFKKDIDLYLSIGMNDYVTKPFEENELFNKIGKQLLRNKAAFSLPTAPINNKYDLSQLRELSRGDEDFVSDMIDIFLQHTPPAMEEMKDTLAEKDYAALAKIAHWIKPSIESMGISQLAGVARDIERYVKSGEIDHTELSGKVHFLIDTLSMVLDKLRKDRT